MFCCVCKARLPPRATQRKGRQQRLQQIRFQVHVGISPYNSACKQENFLQKYYCACQVDTGKQEDASANSIPQLEALQRQKTDLKPEPAADTPKVEPEPEPEPAADTPKAEPELEPTVQILELELEPDPQLESAVETLAPEPAVQIPNVEPTVVHEQTTEEPAYDGCTLLSFHDWG